MSLTSTIRALISATEETALDLGTRKFPVEVARAISLATGIGNGQADTIFSDQRTLGASAAEDLDLAASLIGAFGNTLTFVKLKVLLIYAAAANVNNVRVTRPATNGVPLFLAASDGIDVRPDGLFLFACKDATGVPVTAGTGDLINIANSGAGTSVVYDIVIIGTSA